MKTQNASPSRWLMILSALFLFTFSASADPISLPEKPLTPEITFLISFAILFEALGIWWLLRKFRKPRGFILWILGLHLITYPTFLGLLWLFQDLRPSLAVALGESLIVILEGTLIWLICRYVPAKEKSWPSVSLLRSWLASLAGNACSLITFPLLIKLADLIFRNF